MSLKSLFCRYYIFRITTKFLEKNSPEQSADIVLGTGIPLNLKITNPSPITGQPCIDFNQLPNQKIFETSDLKECQKKASEQANEYPEDLFCIVRIPGSYITGKGTTKHIAWCVPFVKSTASNNQSEKKYYIVPDLILEIYHSYGVVVKNPNYALNFYPVGNILTQEQENAMSQYSWLIRCLRESQTDSLVREECAMHIKQHQKWAQARFDEAQKHIKRRRQKQ